MSETTHATPATAAPTLVEFLRACLDEDERVAFAAAKGTWEAAPGHADIDSWGDEGSLMRIYDEGGHTAADAAHIVAWQPSRALAEIAAKRAILNAYESGDNRGLYGGCGDDCEWKALEYALRLLAQPYRGRPGFDERWAL